MLQFVLRVLGADRGRNVATDIRYRSTTTSPDTDMRYGATRGLPASPLLRPRRGGVASPLSPYALAPRSPALTLGPTLLLRDVRH
eukprot:3129820-Rhodomonas_salina.3